MTKKERRDLMEYCEAIANMFGAKLKWVKEKDDSGGFWSMGNQIHVSRAFATKSRLASVFCHELAHYLNWREGRYPLYHNNNIYGIAQRFHSFNATVDYCHRAEVYTEKRGKELADLFFPGSRYIAFYKHNSKYSKGFMGGYYMISITEAMRKDGVL